MKNILILFVLSLSFVSCCKDPVLIKSGIETRVFGKLTDYRDTPISDLKIKIAEFKVTNNGFFMSSADYEFMGWIDSTYTNTRGNYDFVFKTTGKGNFYRLFIGEEAKRTEPRILSDPFFLDITEISNDMKYIGKEFEFNSTNLLWRYPCIVTFKVDNVETFPLLAYRDPTDYSVTYNFTANGTFEGRFYIQLYYKEIISVNRRKNGVLQSAKYEFPPSNVETTTFQTITVKEADFKDVQ
ncbi:hypothetical protein [Flavobacterium sp. YJ01]|uniref:hypothetical protein n=1 Tax=unclassified Flavobacterium TaxID=196869 RepID=UPI0023E36981|nr:hypothetical protein [Flavobacterium sp. YJ01]WET01112.1 hypothetical protein P0R33_15195 [Flavobacterium sp. YJ01]